MSTEQPLRLDFSTGTQIIAALLLSEHDCAEHGCAQPGLARLLTRCASEQLAQDRNRVRGNTSVAHALATHWMMRLMLRWSAVQGFPRKLIGALAPFGLEAQAAEIGRLLCDSSPKGAAGDSSVEERGRIPGEICEDALEENQEFGPLFGHGRLPFRMGPLDASEAYLRQHPELRVEARRLLCGDGNGHEIEARTERVHSRRETPRTVGRHLPQVRRGNQPHRALPRELALLRNHKTRSLFLSRTRAHDLAVRDQVAPLQKPSARVLLCVDASGSMRGRREIEARAFALAALDLELPNLELLLFSTQAAIRRVGPGASRQDYEGALSVASRGGTDFSIPLEVTREIEGRGVKVRVVVVSDGVGRGAPPGGRQLIAPRLCP